MNNMNQFSILVEEYLNNKKTYEPQIRNFLNFLTSNCLEEQVFNLYSYHIDEFFAEAFKEKIGTESQVTSHISALTDFFSFLISRNYKFSELNGYVSTAQFKKKMLKQVEKTFNKTILSQKLVMDILCSIDDYIEKNSNVTSKNKTKQNTYFEMLIARLYIKLSLILPLKTSQMLDINLGDIKSTDKRQLKYNDILIKIPNNLRKEIIYTINYAEKRFGKQYKKDDKIFHFLYLCIDKKAKPSVINLTLPRIYKELNINEMLAKKIVGKKNKYVYPAECYKITAINSMIRNGVNIVFLAKLTGLDIGTLTSDYNFDDNIPLKDTVSVDINNSIVSCDYFEYL